MLQQDAANLMFDADVRISTITWLAGSFCGGFEDDNFFEEVIGEAASGESYMHSSMSIFQDAPEDCFDDEEFFLEWARETNKLGFIAKVSTPKPYQFYENGGYATNGFGVTAVTYIYVEDLSEVAALAEAWQSEMIAKWRKEALAAEKQDSE